MRIEITPSLQVMKNRFNLNPKYDPARQRLNNHTIVVCNQSVELYRKDAEENKYSYYWDEWFSSIFREKAKLKKVSIDDEKKFETPKEKVDEIIAKTACITEEQLIVGDITPAVKAEYNTVVTISEDTLLGEKKQNITLEDVDDVLNRKGSTAIFNINETPITLSIEEGDSAQLLAKYLSRFYKDSKQITIQDIYLSNWENTRNLNNYILKYLNKNDCNIKFLLLWRNQAEKIELENQFKDYDGFNSQVELASSRGHESFIETEEYKIILGYRLRVFGGRRFGKTEAENITIIRK